MRCIYLGGHKHAHVYCSPCQTRFQVMPGLCRMRYFGRLEGLPGGSLPWRLTQVKRHSCRRQSVGDRRATVLPYMHLLPVGACCAQREGMP